MFQTKAPSVFASHRRPVQRSHAVQHAL